MQLFGKDISKKIIIRVAVTLILLLISGLAYKGWNFYIGRPEYTANLLQDAIVKRDINQIEKFVDIQKMYEDAFDDAFSTSALTDGNDFTNTISSGLVLDEKEQIVGKLVNATRFSLGAKVPEEKIDHFGLFGKIIMIMHENMQSNDPEIRFGGVSVINKTESTADIRLLFFGTKNKKAIPLELRMYKIRDGEWRVSKILNMRKAYRAAEFIIDKSYEEARLKAEEELAKVIEERKKEEQKKVVLPEAERQVASAMVRVLLKKNANKTFDNGNRITYRFSSIMHGPQDTQLSLYNDVIVNKGTNVVKNVTSMILLTNQKTMIDFDKIYLSSLEKGMMVDIKAWEEKGLASKMPIRFELDGQEVIAKAFVATTDDFVDIYKLVFDNVLQISLFQDNRNIGTFVSDDKVRKSIVDFMGIKNIIKDKLYAGNNYVLLPVSNEMLQETEIKLKNEEVKKKKEKQNKQTKAEQDNAVKPENKDANTVDNKTPQKKELANEKTGAKDIITEAKADEKNSDDKEHSSTVK